MNDFTALYEKGSNAQWSQNFLAAALMLAKMVDKYVLLKIISMIEEEPLENGSKKTQRDEKIS